MELGQQLETLRLGLAEGTRLRQELGADTAFLEQIVTASRDIATRIRDGGTVMAAGNGGSFADAQHFTAELVGRFRHERSPLPAICLGANSSTLTAISNDYSYELALAREVEALGRPNDVLVAISTSGRSQNLVRALEAAERLGMWTLCLVGGEGGPMAQMAPALIVPSSDTARIQELHITIIHLICHLIEETMMKERERTT